MRKFRDLALLLLIGFCILQGHIGVGYKNEVEITLEDSTTQKTGFFSGIKNFFRSSPTTTTTTTTTPRSLTQGSFSQQRPPPLTISPAPLVPLGPRPDTPPSSAFGNQPNQPPQWPQVGPSTVSTTSTTVRPQSAFVAPQEPAFKHDQRTGISPNLPGSVISQQSHLGNTHGQRPGSNLPPGFTPYRQEKPQPSGFDLSYGGANDGGRFQQNGNRPGFGLAPMTSSTTTTTTTTTTTMKPTQPQQHPDPQKPQQPHMDIDLRFGSSSTTSRSPAQANEHFPALPTPRRPSIGAREEFPALPVPKSPAPIPASPSRPPSPSAWNSSPQRPGSPSIPAPNNGNRVSFIPSNDPRTQNGGGKPLATDDEIQQLTENLYTKEVNSQLALIQVNIQGKTRSIDSADEAPNPLLVVDTRALESPTIVKLRPLFNNYEKDTLVNEHVTANEHREENEFVDAIMNTNVMRQAMLFLQNKGIVTPDPKTHRDLVKELWFTQYSRGSGKVGSSGFEHVFVNEVKNGTIIGLHNWVYFYEEETAGRLNYKGYMKELNIGTKGKVLKARFTHNGLNKPVNTLFIGTSPELELALYTVCFKLRPDRTCPVSLGNSKFGIITYSWRYRGKDLIGSAYPEI